MKNTLLVIVVLLVGCGKITGYDLNQPMSEEMKRQLKQKKKAAEDNNSKPIKADDNNITKLTPEEQKVVGEYEYKREGFTSKFVFLENGVYLNYTNGKKREGEHRWKVVEGEIHITASDEKTGIWRINKDGSITAIAEITKDGKRVEGDEEAQMTFKRIK